MSLTFNTKLICFYYTPLERLSFTFSLSFYPFFPLFPLLNPLLFSLYLLCLSCDRYEVNVIYENKTVGSSPYSVCVCVHVCICGCVHVSTDIHKLILSTEVLRGCGQQKLVPLEPPLLAVNDTNRDFVSCFFPLHPSFILKFSSSFSLFIHLLI